MELDPILYEGGEGQSPPGISGVMTVEIDCKKQLELQKTCKNQSKDGKDKQKLISTMIKININESKVTEHN